MKEYTLADKVYWVGAVDFNLRSFHHYSTSPKGSTYNAYFINDEKKTLIDTVSCEYFDELNYQLSKHLDTPKLDYIICQHLERDHSGTLAEVVKKYNPDVIFCSKLGLQSMKGQFDTTGWNIQVVADGETISLGKKTVTFYETRMLHWPDSMVSYLNEDKILFSNDIFGQNIASSSRFIDSVDRSIVYHESKHYYANIILPYGNLVLKALEKLSALDIEIVAPDHGLIFRTKEDIAFICQAYKEFAEQNFKKSALIAYDSIWGATSKMAHIIGESLFEEGIPYVLVDVQKNHVAEIANHLMDCSIIILGSATRNNNYMSAMASVVNHIKGLSPKNRYGASFGSYGWSGEAPKLLSQELESMGCTILADPLKVQYGLKENQIQECKDFAKKIVKAINEINEVRSQVDFITNIYK